MQFAYRMNALSSAIFQRLDQEKNQLLREKRDVYNFSIGTPDLPPAKHIVDAVALASTFPENYKYAVQDLPELQEAVLGWYKKRFDVSLTRDMVLALSGSQDGLAHIGLLFADPGDLVLVPDPGYPIFSIGPYLAGAEVIKMPLLAENNYLIDFSKIDFSVAEKAKYMIVSYPSNPVTALATDQFMSDLIVFAKQHEIAVIYDNAYSEFVFEGKGKSFLSYPGACEVGIELNSLSKSYSLSGGRIAFAIGNSQLIEQLRILKSHLDYGVFLPVQYGAIAALNGPQDDVANLSATYQKRMELLVHGLTNIGWIVEKSPGTMFLWAPIPPGWESDEAFTYAMLEATGVIVVPGTVFGEAGKGYVRFALVQPELIISEALNSLKKWSDLIKQ